MEDTTILNFLIVFALVLNLIGFVSFLISLKKGDVEIKEVPQPIKDYDLHMNELNDVDSDINGEYHSLNTDYNNVELSLENKGKNKGKKNKVRYMDEKDKDEAYEFDYGEYDVKKNDIKTEYDGYGNIEEESNNEKENSDISVDVAGNEEDGITKYQFSYEESANKNSEENYEFDESLYQIEEKDESLVSGESHEDEEVVNSNVQENKEEEETEEYTFNYEEYEKKDTKFSNMDEIRNRANGEYENYNTKFNGDDDDLKIHYDMDDVNEEKANNVPTDDKLETSEQEEVNSYQFNYEEKKVEEVDYNEAVENREDEFEDQVKGNYQFKHAYSRDERHKYEYEDYKDEYGMKKEVESEENYADDFDYDIDVDKEHEKYYGVHEKENGIQDRYEKYEDDLYNTTNREMFKTVDFSEELPETKFDIEDRKREETFNIKEFEPKKYANDDIMSKVVKDEETFNSDDVNQRIEYLMGKMKDPFKNDKTNKNPLDEEF